MRARLTKVAAALAALTALAFGGSAIASAAQKGAPTPTPAAQQQADQLGNSGPNVQQGDQSAPDTGSVSESASESAATGSASESQSAESDGPGGYADSNANANTQQTGEN